MADETDRYVQYKTFAAVVGFAFVLFSSIFGLWLTDHDKLTKLIAQEQKNTDSILQAISEVR